MAEKTENTSLELVGKFEQLIIDSKALLFNETIKDQEKFDQLIEFTMNLKVENLDSRAIYEQIVTQFKEVKKIKVIVDKKRKELTAPATEYQKTIKAYGDGYLNQLKSAEDHLAAEKQKFDDLLKAEQNRIFSERSKLLASNGYQLTGQFYVSGPVQISIDNIAEMDQDGFEYHLELGQAELKRKQAEKERAEQMEKDRLAIQKEREQLAKDRAEMAKLRAELEAQKQALDATYKKAEEKPKAEENVETPSNYKLSPTEPVKDSKPTDDKKTVEIFQDGKSKEKVTIESQSPKTEEFGDIFENLSISPEQIGFNQCRMRVLEFMEDPYLKTKTALKEKINSVQYVVERKK